MTTNVTRETPTAQPERDAAPGHRYPPPVVRTPEEIEALIAELDCNAEARMQGRENLTDSVAIIRRQRAARSRTLRRRH